MEYPDSEDMSAFHHPDSIGAFHHDYTGALTYTFQFCDAMFLSSVSDWQCLKGTMMQKEFEPSNFARVVEPTQKSSACLELIVTGSAAETDLKKLDEVF